MSLFTLYLITTLLPNLHEAGSAITSICAFIIAFSGLTCFMAFDKEDKATGIKVIKYALIPFIIGGAFTILTPDSTQIYALVGGSFATNIEGVNKLPANVVKAANDFLESMNKETPAKK